MIAKIPPSLLCIISYGVAFGGLRMLVGGISVLYLLANGVSLTQLGYLKAFSFAMMLMLDMPLSYIADRYSRKFSTVMGILFGALWLMTTAFANNLSMFYVAEVFNALSLSLFNGAYIAYLIDYKNTHYPTIDTATILAWDNKYNSYAMALCAFLGAAFVSPSSSLIWWVGGALLLLCAVGAYGFLPKDIHAPQDATSLKGIALLKQHKDEISTHMPAIAPSLSMLVVALILMQIIIQLWQPFLQNFNPYESGIVYGVFFSVIAIAQALASDFVNAKIVHKQCLLYTMLGAALVLMAAGVLFLGKNHTATIWMMVALFGLFFALKYLLITASAAFHGVIPAKHRATFDALSALMSRVVLMVVLPLLTFLMDRFGLMSLVLALAVLVMISLKRMRA